MSGVEADINFVRDDYMRIRPWSWIRMLDLLLDYGKPKGYLFSTFTEHESLAHLMHRAGLFASVGEARRNGWNKPVPPGYSTYSVGRGMRRRFVTVVNIYAGIDDHACSFAFCRCGTQRGFAGKCPFDVKSEAS